MAIFALKCEGDDMSTGQLVEAASTNLDLEKDLEDWLEHSPGALTNVPTLWIGRQTSAPFEEKTIFPDLLGIDSTGNLVIIELKKGRAPRDVIAQLLEYAAWAHTLRDDTIIEIATTYFQTSHDGMGKNFQEVFCDVFEVDELPVLNSTQRLFIIAEDIPPAIARVCRFLRTVYSMEISCIALSVYQTQHGEMVVNSELIVGQEDVTPSKRQGNARWSGEKSVKQLVWETVQALTQQNYDTIFTPKEVADVIHQRYPDCNTTTIRCQMISDCVNHRSRHHYPGGQDRYWWAGERGKFRLFHPQVDQIL